MLHNYSSLHLTTLHLTSEEQARNKLGMEKKLSKISAFPYFVHINS